MKYNVVTYCFCIIFTIIGLSIEDIDYKRYPSKEFQMSWIQTYLMEYLDNATPSHADIEKIYKEVQQFSLVSHFLWGIWSLVQYELSDIDFDFGGYAEIRLNKYYEQKNSLFMELL